MTTETHVHTTRCWWDPEQASWICTHETPPTREPESPMVDVRDMIVVHTALLREFRLAPAAVARVEPGATRRAGGVDRHLGLLCDLLHHHHQGEDELLWPKLSDRVPGPARAFLQQVENQHLHIDVALQTVAVSRARWTGDPSTGNRDVLAADLEVLHDLLKEHLELEESAVLPLAASFLTEDEWLAVGEAAVESMPKPALLLAFGMFAYEGDPAVLADMLRSAPLPVRVILPRVAPRLYARRARRVHGTRRP